MTVRTKYKTISSDDAIAFDRMVNEFLFHHPNATITFCSNHASDQRSAVGPFFIAHIRYSEVTKIVKSGWTQEQVTPSTT